MEVGITCNYTVITLHCNYSPADPTPAHRQPAGIQTSSHMMCMMMCEWTGSLHSILAHHARVPAPRSQWLLRVIARRAKLRFRVRHRACAWAQAVATAGSFFVAPVAAYLHCAVYHCANYM